MSVFHNCSDLSDATLLSSSYALYLKPVARLNVSVQLPALKSAGKSFSNTEVMQKLRQYAAPEEFTSLKVSKTTLEVVRFEGDIESRAKLPAVIARLDGRSIKLSGFHENLKVRAAEAKPDFPTKHAWDSYFRDAKNMNEMKPGERPDTIHITNLPCKWFSARSDPSKPCEYILRRTFDVFGEVRCVDIPMLDPFRTQMKPQISGVKMFSNNQNMIFEAYIQYKDYMCFVKTMDTLRGMKLVHKQPDGKAFSASIKVDFDKSKHMSEGSIRRRRLERERLMAKEREREELEQAAREETARNLAEERKRVEEEEKAKMERQRQREERRKGKQLERLKRQEADEMNQKIVTEERLLLMAQRRLESFRLLGELFNQLKIKREKARDKYKDESLYRSHRSRHKNQPDGTAEQEKELRDKLVKKFKHSKGVEKREEIAEQREDTDQEYPDFKNYSFDNNHFNEQHQRGGHRGGPRGGRRNNWFGRGRRGAPFMNHQFPQMPFQPFPNRGFLPPRGFPRWPRIPRGRLEPDPSFVAPFIPPYYLDSAINDPYYKYFSKLAGYSSRRSRSLSRSLSRSRSRSSRRRSSSDSRRSHSRSQSRSRRRSSRSRSRSRRRSRSRSRSRSRRRSRSRSRSKRKSRSRKRHTSHSRSHSSKRSNAEDKRESVSKPPVEQKADEDSKKHEEKAPSVHTWSRSPSKTRSLSWEKQADEPTSSTKPHKHKKEKKKGKKDKKKKKKKETE